MTSLFIKQPILLLLTYFIFINFANAHYNTNDNSGEPIILAQNDEVDDSYDPFADYSEFENNSDEEADINFFRNGRFFTMGFVGGVKGFTGNLQNLYKSSPTYGIFLSYFFDLRFALQFSFSTSDHGFYISEDNKSLDGNVSLSSMAFDLKYYFNTQNVTRGLANLNPYLIGGFSQNYRTYSLSNTDGFGRDSTLGADIGAGIEIPMMRKKSYFGVQVTYHLVNFADENSAITIPGGTGNPVDDVKTDVKPYGDIYDLMFILGLNF